MNDSISKEKLEDRENLYTKSHMENNKIVWSIELTRKRKIATIIIYIFMVFPRTHVDQSV